MTQEQLAKAAGISHRTLVNIETKRVTEPHFSTILKLAEALERVMNLGEKRIEMRIPQSVWFTGDLCFPHS